MVSHRKRRRLVALAKGHVQGVGYRSFCADHAMRLNIDGYAMNRRDGRVEVVGECDEGTLRQLVKLMREGPTFAVVEDVSFRWEEPTGEYRGFESVI